MKNIKNKKQTRSANTGARRRINSAQILFAIFAIILILSMVFSAFAKF